jgi:hypothetical protein
VDADGKRGETEWWLTGKRLMPEQERKNHHIGNCQKRIPHFPKQLIYLTTEHHNRCLFGQMSFIPDVDPKHTDYITKQQLRVSSAISACLVYYLTLAWAFSLPHLGTLLLQFFDEPDEVEDDPLAFRGDDALRVELDTLK